MTESVLFVEPGYDSRDPSSWELQAGYKYPSILGQLGKRMGVVVSMESLPPKNDPFAARLRDEFGVRFEKCAFTIPALSAQAERLGTPVISNLRGRKVDKACVIARASVATGRHFVYRLGGDDLRTRLAVTRNRSSDPYNYFRSLQQEREGLNQASRVIVMTEREKRRCAALVPNPDKIKVLYRGVDTSAFKPSDTGPKQTGRLKRILFVGRQSGEKGVDIIDSVSDRALQMGLDFEFGFAGKLSLNRAPNRKFHGFLAADELPPVFREYDALMIVSRSEGLPQVLMEAMATGLPVFAPRELFAETFPEHAGLTLIDLNPTSIIEVLSAVAEQPQTVSLLADQAYRYASTNFDQQTQNDAYCALMESLVNSGTLEPQKSGMAR